MYTYSIFLFKNKVATNYFYKTSILRRFLEEYRDNRRHSYIKLQYRYITEPFTLDKLFILLKKANPELELERRNKQITVYWKSIDITFYEDGRHLIFYCKKVEDAESYLFPLMRASDLQFYVINHRTNDYGWLSVNKFRKMDKKQILFT